MNLRNVNFPDASGKFEFNNTFHTDCVIVVELDTVFD